MIAQLDLPLDPRSPAAGAGEPSTDELKHGLKVAARVVLLYGDRYMPIVDRLEAEIARRNSALTTRERLRAIAEAAE
jgi:hypothetical protein